jgi:diguanylate cyclase (GGDEF)-like protein
VRPDDLVARYGGDEFVLLLKLNSPEEAAAVARRIRAARSQPLELDGAATYTISVSIGIAFAAPAGSLLDELIAAADRAMYRAKSSAGGEGFAFAVSGDER